MAQKFFAFLNHYKNTSVIKKTTAVPEDLDSRTWPNPTALVVVNLRFLQVQFADAHPRSFVKGGSAECGGLLCGLFSCRLHPLESGCVKDPQQFIR